MEFIKRHYKLILFSIPLISFALHYYVFNLDLVGIHVWRQTETQTVINNFYRESLNIFYPHVNDFKYPGRVMQSEFPLMQWLFALCYRMLGPHIAITRVLSFIIGLFSVYGMFYLCDKIFKNKTIATLCAWCFNFSPVFYYYTLNPMPDNMALCCAIWSTAFFYSYINTSKIKFVIWSALFLGIATMVKLPFILFGSFMFTFLVVQIKRREYSLKQLTSIFFIYVLFVIPAIAWYTFVMSNLVGGLILGAFDIKQSFSYWLYILQGNLLSVLPELIINYASVLFFIAGFYFLFSNKLYRNKNFNLFLFWGVSVILYFLYELNMIDTVHDYYLFPFLPPIFLLVAYGAYHMLMKRGVSNLLALFCLCALPFTAFLRIHARCDTKDPGFDAAYYEYEKELRNLTPQNAYCIVCNDPSNFILLYYIDRKGWALKNDQLNNNVLTDCISKGAKYIFLVDQMDSQPEIRTHLDGKIFDKNNLKVYKLK